jgi:hypothetical protein
MKKLCLLPYSVGTVLLVAGFMASSASAQEKASAAPASVQQPSDDDRAAAMAAEAKMKEAAAIPTPRTADGHPDLTGLWVPATHGKHFGPAFAPGKVVTPDGRSLRPVGGTEEEEIAGDTEAVAFRRADTGARPVYKPQFVATARDNFDRASHVDPAFRCQPLGVPRIGAPTEIFQHGDSVVLLYQSGANSNVFRVIPTDNRPHDPDADEMANGDSVGHWEGDTLVIDVTSLNPDTWLDGDGSFHDRNLHVIEKFTRQGNTLKYEVTEEDPTLFAQAYAPKTRMFVLGKPGEHAQENYPCDELDQEHLTTNERH